MSTDFGRDTWCEDSLRTGRYATGTRLVAQACFHRLITPRGALMGGTDEQDFGIDLSALVGSIPSELLASSLPAMIRSELTKDERVLLVDTTVVSTTVGVETTYTITIVVTTSAGPFTLMLSVSSVTVALIGLVE